MKCGRSGCHSVAFKINHAHILVGGSFAHGADKPAQTHRHLKVAVEQFHRAKVGALVALHDFA